MTRTLGYGVARGPTPQELGLVAGFAAKTQDAMRDAYSRALHYLATGSDVTRLC